MTEFVAVLALEDLQSMRAVMAGGRRVLLVRVGDEVRAYDNRCPHRAWPLERGTLAGGVLTCANHRYTFDVATGRGLDPGDCHLVPYPCRVEGGTIAVAVP
ncbi:toluene 4-monooxygenase protein C [Actinomycetospora succinea]|uniref:Toluene 4-monooxygenase protein C n=1 Tax=Actinomycetospora succinea TaxID=663603 RepID=A0A4R6UQ59_9PSEU|nr:Rieske 2Fe-2S domain-containing protein [Actinomycetospora succinea]TDQ47839.1 toluene 4-monooxygenase protein C [Actinomycetospora succinea]